MKLQNQTQKLVQLGFIYCLKNPKNKDIFYVGATESAPKDRLLGHYYHFKEYLKAQAAVDAEIAYNSQFSCYAERIVSEKLTMINNNATICNLAYDAKIAMLHEDLNAFIDEKESV